MRVVFSVAILSAGIVTMLGGCDANQLYMGSKTVGGVNAGVNPDQTNGWLVVGYDRTFAAVVPRSVDDPTTGRKEAMASLVCSRVAVKGITLKQYRESIATGKAAEDFSEALKTNPAPGKDFFEGCKDKPASGTAQTGGGEG